MKKIYYGIMMLLTIFAIQSCDSLDLAPEDYNASGNYWQNENQVSMFSRGLHNDLRAALNSDWSNMYFRLGEVRGATIRTGSNIMNTSTQYSSLINNILDEDNTGVSDWGGFYSKILQVNILIQNLDHDNVDILSADSKNYYLGIGYGLRAYYYFWLYRTYGGVPLELSNRLSSGEISAEGLYLGRSSAEATLKQIKEDVNKSVEFFNNTKTSTTDFHYWNKDASLMLKGEVYLWSAKVTTNDATEKHTATGKSDLNVAKEALLAINNHSLCKDFATIFSHDGKSYSNNKETILALYYDKDELTNQEFTRSFVYHNNFNSVKVVDEDGNQLIDPLQLNGGGLMYNEFRQSLVDSFDKTDSRRNATFLEYYTADNHTFGCSLKKFVGQTVSNNHYFDADIVLYRYADALLMLAEIENGLDNGPKCAEYINMVRERAYGSNYGSAVQYSDGGKAANELAILKERDKEFVCEGKRWFDLLRLQDVNGDALVFSKDAAYSDEGVQNAVLDKATESHKVLWPINTTVMTNDPLIKQTYGYKSNY